MEAIKFLKKNIKNENLIKHCLVVGAIMERLVVNLGEDAEKWKKCGLLHDIDYNMINGDFYQHGLVAEKILRDFGAEEDVIKAIKVHNRRLGLSPETNIEKAICIADALSGLLVASVLVLPSKKISDLKIEIVFKKFKEKSFAEGVNRESISQCIKFFNLGLRDFISLGILSIQKILEELNL